MAERIKRGDRKDGVWLKDLDPLQIGRAHV